MNKATADQTITKYLKKIYGFSLSKTMNIDRAEELSARISYEVYKALIKTDQINNLDGYIYRLCQNEFLNFISEDTKENKFKQDLILNPSNNRWQSEIASTTEDELQKIRNEIVYLSKTQREIMIMHYYDKVKIKDIAEKLNISIQNVKWHLFDARNKIKDGFGTQKEIKYPPEYKKFSYMGNYGFIGPLVICLPFYLSSTLSQNIVYSTFQKAKSCTELAKELHIPTVFIENEIEHLMENNLIIKTEGRKYLSNVYITKINDEKIEKTTKLVEKYAKIICNTYIPNLFQAMKHYDKNKIYTPNNDVNFLMWSVICFVCLEKFTLINKHNEMQKFYSKRRYHELNLGYAKINESTKINSMLNHDFLDEYKNSTIDPVEIWRFSSYFDDRKDLPDQQLLNEGGRLYEYMHGNLKREIANIDIYRMLMEKGHLISKGKTEIVNIIVTMLTKNDFSELFPPIPENLIELSEEIDESYFQINKHDVPTRMHDLCKIMSKNFLSSGLMRAMIIETLLENGLLKPLKKNQRLSVNTIIFSDVLPSTQ